MASHNCQIHLRARARSIGFPSFFAKLMQFFIEAINKLITAKNTYSLLAPSQCSTLTAPHQWMNQHSRLCVNVWARWVSALREQQHRSFAVSPLYRLHRKTTWWLSWRIVSHRSLASLDSLLRKLLGRGTSHRRSRLRNRALFIITWIIINYK